MINRFSEWPRGSTVAPDYKIPSDLQYADMTQWRRLMGMKQILVMMAVGCGKGTNNH